MERVSKEGIKLEARRQNGSRVIFRLHIDTTLPDLISEFTYFLRACSYIFPESLELGLINPDDVILPAKEHNELIRELDELRERCNTNTNARNVKRSLKKIKK
jgi:hypothetical protein